MTENTTATHDDAGAPEETTIAAPATRKDGRDERTRARLRDTESRLAAAEARAAALAVREVTRLLAEHLEGPQDALTLAGRDPMSFVSEDGTVDEDAIRAFAEDTISGRPHLRKMAYHHADLGARGLAATRSAGWGDVLAGRRR